MRNMLTFMKVIEMIKKLTTNINFRLLIKDRKLDLAEYWDLVYVSLRILFSLIVMSEYETRMATWLSS